MISKKAWKIIKQINNKIPKEWQDKLMKHVIDRSYEDEAKKILKEGTYTKEEREKIQEAIDDGKFLREYDEMDTKIEKKINDFIERRIKEEMESGRLPKMRKDKWYARIMKKTEQV